MFTRLTILSVLVLPLVLAPAQGEAQSKSRQAAKSQTSNAAIEARHKCFLEAQAQVPADPDQNITQSRRLPVYAACARRMGVRP